MSVQRQVRVALGLPHITNTVHGAFMESLLNMCLNCQRLGIEVVPYHTYRTPIAFARNRICSDAIKDPYATHVLFLDDDMVFKPDLLQRLLHAESSLTKGWRVGALGALTFTRSEPHYPSVWMRESKGIKYNPVAEWDDTSMLLSCDAIGMAATLIPVSTLMDLAKVRDYHNGIFAFFTNDDYLGEDFNYCRTAKFNDYDIVCDMSTVVGHLVEKEIRYGDFAAYMGQGKYNISKFMAEKNYEKNTKKETSEKG